jgi:signal transduction histidine kinase
LGYIFKEVSEKLRHKEEIQEQLLGKVIRAQEEERKRVARELHDEVGQALTIIMMDLAQTRDILPNEATEARKRVSQSRSVAERTLTDLRKLIYELRPEVLDQLGLVAALRSYIKSRLQTEDIKVQLNLNDMQNQLTLEVETILFRVVQEAINNILRHSRATIVEIEMEIEDSMVIATVKDNGIGFNVEAKLTNIESFGLLGIRERVAIVGGGLSIESKAGYGSCLKVSIPLNGV